MQQKLWYPRCGLNFLGLFLVLLTSRIAWGSPATFITALPVAQDQVLARFNWDVLFGSNDLENFQFPFDFAYGLNARWTLFTTFDLTRNSINSQQSNSVRQISSGGFGDTLAFARYTIFSKDKPGSTLRLAPVAGLFLPSGSNTLHNAAGLLPQPLQTSSGAISPYIGLAAGWNSARYGFAADSTFRHNPITQSGINPGDQFRADGQTEFILHPTKIPMYGLPKELWISIEENFQHNSRSHIYGAISPSSGGLEFDEDAVLEYATLHYEVGSGIQVPLVEDFNGSSDVREKSRFIFFTEFYFSGFRGHTK